MDRLVQQDAAALQSPGAAPGSGLVVGLRSEGRLDQDRPVEPAEGAGLYQLAHTADLRPEAVLEDNPQGHAGLPGGGDHLVGLRQGRRDGLLGQDVLPGLEGRHGDRRMERVRRADGYGVHVRVHQHVFQGLVEADAMLLRLCPRTLSVDVVDSHQPGGLHVLQV